MAGIWKHMDLPAWRGHCGREQDHGIAATRHMIDDVALLAPEIPVPENVTQHRQRRWPLVALGRKQF
jgi:hypothetical protein